MFDFSQLKIAYVHDWLTGMRGGEKVLEEIIKIFGNHDLFTLVYNKDEISDIINACNIKTSFIQNLPFAKRKYQYYLPLFPLAIESFDLNDYDLIISTSACVARGVITPPNSFHWAYIHSPTRYAWDQRFIYQKAQKPKILMKFLWPLVMHYFRQWEINSIQRIDHFVANSNFVKKRIQKYYKQEAEVIYPPVFLDDFSLNTGKRSDYYLVLSALVPYKRIDLAIKACLKSNRRLIVAGSGPELSNLKALAQDSKVEFLGKVSFNKIKDLYANARGFLFPGLEDFGITPLESLASGTPVIAFKKGGALETVTLETGEFFEEQTVESLLLALERFEKRTFDPKILRKQAEKFSQERFKKEVLASLSQAF